MGKLVNLFKYKKPVTLKKGKTEIEVWLRVVGDDDITDAYRIARVDSAKARAIYRDPKTAQHQDQIKPIEEATEEQAKELILAARANDFTALAIANVERPELPEIKDVAVDPDAPTLEEQEKLDALIREQEEEHQKALLDYIEQNRVQLESELSEMDLRTLRKTAMEDASSVIALGVFLQRAQDEKVWRSVYMDKACKERGYDSYEEFNSEDRDIKEQLRAAYVELETDPQEIKK